MQLHFSLLVALIMHDMSKVPLWWVGKYR